MEMPSLPTDNLYKFLALLGLIIVIFVVVYFHIRMDKTDEEITALKQDVIVLNHEIYVANNFTDKISDEIIRLESEFDKYDLDDDTLNDYKISISEVRDRFKDESFRKFSEFLFNYRHEIFPAFKIFDDLETKIALHDKTREELELKIKLHKYKQSILDKKVKELSKLSKELYIFLFIGSIMSLYGFQLWYRRVQIHLDKKLKNEVSNNEMDRSKEEM